MGRPIERRLYKQGRGVLPIYTTNLASALGAHAYTGVLSLQHGDARLDSR
jgi:hypothetical protein